MYADYWDCFFMILRDRSFPHNFLNQIQFLLYILAFMVARLYTEKSEVVIGQGTGLTGTGKLKEYLIKRSLIAIFSDFSGRLQRECKVFCSAAKIMITKSVEEQ